MEKKIMINLSKYNGVKKMNFTLLSSFLAVSLVTSVGHTQNKSIDDVFPKIELSKNKYQGEEAIRALTEENLTDLAEHYKTTPENLKKLFRNDKTLKMDKGGKLYYAEENLPSEATLGDGSFPNNPEANQIPDSETFKLHSKPSSVTGKLYLNFNGRTVRSNYWNGGASFVTEPYNKDGVAGFSSDELTQIRSMWLAVAEDFAAFNIDVTTEPPVNADYTRFMEIIVTPSHQWYGTSAGGVCYIGSFNWNDSPNQVCFAFSAMLQNGTKYLSEVISHESGHAFGLHHWSKYDLNTKALVESYASGQDNWAPIMGNSYYRAVSSWSKGEYLGASTAYGFGNFQDDMASISGMPGVGYASDEAGSTTTSQVVLKGTSTNGLTAVNHMGIISNANDVDVYRIDLTQPGLNLAIKPVGYSPNLDFKVQLLHGNGALVIDPVSGLPALDANPNSINLVTFDNSQLAMGTYYLRISPSGYLDNISTNNYLTGYSSYGSNGQYQVTGSYYTTGPVVTAPAQLNYSSVNSVYSPNLTIAPNMPSSSGGPVDAYSVTPALPAGLLLNAQTGVISGTPLMEQILTSYTVTASNSAGSASVNLTMEVKVVAPSYSSITLTVPTQVKFNRNVAIKALPSGNTAIRDIQIYVDNILTCTFTSAVNGQTYSCSKRIKNPAGASLSIKAVLINIDGSMTTSDIKQVLVIP